MTPLEIIRYDSDGCRTWHPCSTTCPIVDGAGPDDDYVSGICDVIDAEGDMYAACWHSLDEVWMKEQDGCHERIFPTYWRYRKRQ